MMIIDLDLDLVAKWTMKKCRLYIIVSFKAESSI